MIPIKQIDFSCKAPWTNLHVNTDGKAQPCCRGVGIQFDLTEIDQYIQTLHPQVVAIKQDLINNQQPEPCQDCNEYTWYDSCSDLREFGPHHFQLESLDLRWSNTCQLTCMYCNAYQSSSWSSIIGKYTGQPIIPHKIIKQQQLLDFVKENKGKIKRVNLLGGEPLLLSQNIDILEILDPDVTVDIFTNLNCNLQKNDIFNRLIDRPNVYWTVSMENIGKKFEFVRRNASWTKQHENILALLEGSKSQYDVTLQSQFCVYSATSITELYEYARQVGLNIHWSWLTGPKPLDFIGFPDRFKAASLEQLGAIESLKNVNHFVPDVDQCKEKLRNSFGLGHQENVQLCVNWHKEIESKYLGNKMHFLDLWPEFA